VITESPTSTKKVDLTSTEKRLRATQKAINDAKKKN
jgi:hypothetical protein